MNLSKDDVAELNGILADKKAINLPDFRRTVTASGGNYQWLQQHITKFNAEAVEGNPRLKQLLRL